MLTVSIIVPFYNAVNFLEKLVNSILSQTYSNLELLLINDGSTDGSDSLAAELVSKDQRIKLFTQINKGVSAARNVGLKQANGDYLMFVDADDWIHQSMIYDIVNEIERFKDVDLVRLTSQKVYNREDGFSPNDTFISKLYTPLNFIKENLLGGYMHSLFIKASIVRQNNIWFTDDMKFMEDQEFSLKCFLHANRILYYSKTNYFYYQNQQATSLSSLNNVIANSADMLKCGYKVYNYALKLASDEMMVMIRKYTFRKVHQYLKTNMSYRNKATKVVTNEMKQFLKETGIGIHQIGFSNLMYYYIIKSGLRSFLAKS